MGTVDSILNFIIPLGVIGLLFWMVYRIPIIKEGVDALINKFRNWKEGREHQTTTGGRTLQSIQYE
jgi:hypothetical protein